MNAKKTIVGTYSEIQALMKSNFTPKVNLLAFYNSLFDRIIRNPELMTMSIMDRQFHLAHSVFDSMTCDKCKIPLLERIIKRIGKSSQIAGIELPMSLEQIQAKISHVASFCASEFGLQKSKFFIRVFVSSGISDFSILPSKDTKPILYIIAFTTPNDFDLTTVYKEVSIPSNTRKEGSLIHSKTSNYLSNTLIAMQANLKGGLNGVMLDKEGYITECTIANVGFVWKHTRKFIIPKWEKVLKGNTLVECITHIEKKLIPEGIISKVEQKDLKPNDVYGNIEEMLVFGGGKVIAIGNFDGYFIRNDLGPICKALQSYIREEYNNKTFEIDPTLYKPSIPRPKL